MDNEQETTDTKTAGAVAVGPATGAPPVPVDVEDELALEPHIVRGLD
ncbi:hypothetical protein [Streptomyces cylindrosporus]|uniref:Uncharacterized protein n=1 Tax=Streptomyces cylindrosporus TaxID=2927583 RepID=A0ABS9YQH7_9ACTN|nr:hypothetical protein [Streptomyces cylindrosporus]MCI3278830.1 hypothetical protein [Streptomyces cylindrosporus]